MIKSLSLLFLSLLAYTLADDSSGRHRHHGPDTAPDMDLKPAFQRTTESPHSHSHDFSLPLPSGGLWNRDYRESHTESYDYEVTMTDKDYAYELSTTDYDWTGMESSASGDYEAKHDHPMGDDVDEKRDSTNEMFASSAAVNKLITTLLFLVVTLLLIS